MVEMKKEELFRLANKVVKISRLRKELPDIKSRKKEDFLGYLYKNNKDFLEYLVNYYTLLKKRSVFFSYLKKKINFQKLKNRKIVDEDNDLIFEFRKVTSSDNQFLVNVKAHSRTYEYKNVEDPETLVPINVRFRRPFTLYFIYHLDTLILECRTRSLNKFEIVKKLLEKIFNLPSDSIVLIKLKEDEYRKIDESVRYKFVRVSGLKIAGADEINIKGFDVERTLNYFKNKNIDLGKLSSKVELQRADTNKKPITFYENGRISYRPQVKDIYVELKEVLLKHVKNIK
ncbi:MAG: hypothetical protein ACTSVB_06660 [Candidatus Heimdallarchaeaceae archaeon]